MQEITLNAIKSQRVTVSLNNTSYTIRIHQRSTGLFLDLYLGDTAIAQGVLCLNCNWIVRYAYLGFPGDLVFVDTKGAADPYWDELGGRFKLYFLTSSEISS